MMTFHDSPCRVDYVYIKLVESDDVTCGPLSELLVSEQLKGMRFDAERSTATDIFMFKEKPELTRVKIDKASIIRRLQQDIYGTSPVIADIFVLAEGSLHTPELSAFLEK